MPCVWLRTSATVHKIAITTATLLVTSLLVASPVLFLLSTAPSQLPKDCNTKSDVNCVTRPMPRSECTTITCRQAMISIQARTNWKIDPCQDFKSFSCATTKSGTKTVKSIQEGVDTLMQRKQYIYWIGCVLHKSSLIRLVGRAAILCRPCHTQTRSRS